MSAAAPDLGAAAPGAPAPASPAEPASGALRSAQLPEAPPSAGLPEPPTDEARQLAALEHAFTTSPEWSGALKGAMPGLEAIGYDRPLLLRIVHAARAEGIDPQTAGKLASLLARETKAAMPTGAERVEMEAEHVEHQYNATIETLREELGDRFDYTVRSAGAMVERIFGKEGAEAIANIELADGSLLGNNTAIIKAMAGAARNVAALRSSGVVAEGREMDLDPSQARDLAEMFAHEHHEAITSAGHRLHDLRLRQWQALVAASSAPAIPVALPSSARAPAARSFKGTGIGRNAEPAPTPPRVTMDDVRAFQQKHQAALLDAFHHDHGWALQARARLLEQVRSSSA